MERREFYSNKRKFAWWLCIGLAVLAGGVFQIRNGGDLSERAIGWLGVVFFGLGTVYSIKELLRSGPRLVLSDEGLFDRSLGTQVIPWQSILRVDATRVKKSGLLSLQLTEEAQRLAGLSVRTRAVTSWNKMLGSDPGNLIHTDLSSLRNAPVEVVASIVEYRNHFASRRQGSSQAK